MKRVIIAALVLIPVLALATDTPEEPEKPVSPPAVAAIKKHDDALGAARKTYLKAQAAAEQQLVGDLDKALTFAMHSKNPTEANLKEANRINAAKKEAAKRLQADTGDGIAAWIVGTSWKTAWIVGTNRRERADITYKGDGTVDLPAQQQTHEWNKTWTAIDENTIIETLVTPTETIKSHVTFSSDRRYAFRVTPNPNRGDNQVDIAALVLIPVLALASDTPEEPEKPVSPPAVAAIKKHDDALGAARKTYLKAQAAAEQQLVGDLDKALTFAMHSKNPTEANLKEANRINAAKKEAAKRLQADTGDGVAAWIVGTSWQARYDSGGTYKGDGTVDLPGQKQTGGPLWYKTWTGIDENTIIETVHTDTETIKSQVTFSSDRRYGFRVYPKPNNQPGIDLLMRVD